MNRMPAKQLPSTEYLHECLRYDEETGLLTWRPRPLSHFFSLHSCSVWNGKYAGRPAFIGKTGSYLRGRIDVESYLAHRVIWKMMHGAEPRFIDHIDGNAHNNRIANLREVTAAENNRNRTPRRRTSNPYPRVRQQKHGWTVAIAHKHIGTFSSFEEALAARKREEVARGYIMRELA